VDIAAWLRELGLERYEPAFRDNEIDWEVLPELTEGDLEKIGLPLGPRKKLLKAIAGLSAAPPVGEVAAAEAPGASRQAERRQLTVLFCDLVGSTDLARRLDPEELGGMMHVYQGACAEVVRGWDGYVAKFMGDGVLAYFGWPRAHEDDAERAVRAGLAVVEAVASLKAPCGESLSVRVGIATGPVVVGELVGEGAAQEEAVVGETPNLAARLQALAEPGTVVIGEATRRLLGGLLDLLDLGPQRLKGFTEPVSAFRVVGEGRAEGRFEALRGGHLTPLVGREHELGFLLERWAWARDGEGQVVLLAGEPGVGKSRLVRALRERLGAEPHTPLSHYCAPYHVTTALHPVIELLSRAADLARDEPPEQQLTKLGALLAPSSECVDEAVALIAALLAIPTGERYSLPTDLAPQRLKQRTFEVLLDQLEGLAAARPVLAVYEDVHWSDPTTLELLDLVIERVQRLPVLVLITFRPEFRPPWGGRGHVTQLPVNRLGRRQAAAIVERVSGGRALPPEVLEQIVLRTDGVPLFVEELTKTVLESGLLQDAGDRYELTGPLPPLAIPATLQDSLMARLDRLATVREVAQMGAVLGREFSHELLAAVAPLGDNELRSALAELVAAELLLRRGTPPNAAYSFRHMLVQEVAYQSLLRSRRQLLHARVATTLEERFPEVASVEPEVLAYHFTEAGLAEPAVAYWSRAGHRAAERSAYAEAMTQLKQGLEVLRTLPAGAERDHQELDLLTALGSILISTKGHPSPEVAGLYLRARELCHALGDTPHLGPVLQGLRIHRLLRAELGLAREAGEELLALADRAGDDGYRLEAQRALGVVSFYIGDLVAAHDFFAAALALYDAEVHRAHALRYEDDPGMTCLGYLGRTLWLRGYPEQALRPVGEAVELARGLAHPPSLAEASAWQADMSLLRRETDLCREQAGAALALAREHGFPLWTALSGASWGWAETHASEEGTGITALRQALDGLQGIGDRLFRPYYQALLADALWRLGRPQEALAELDQAKEWAYGTEARYWDAELHRLRGEILATLDGAAPPQAEGYLRTAIDIAQGQNAKSLELRAATGLARLWAEQGERHRAHDLLAPVYGWFTEGFDTDDLKEAKALLDKLQ